MISQTLKSGLLIRSLRFFFYVLIAAFYWAFMRSHAPLGIAWRPFHAQRVFNAVNHMVNGSPLLTYGFTSWNGLNESVEKISASQPVEVYLVSPLHHFIQSLFVVVYPTGNLTKIGSFADYIMICAAAICAAEIIAKVIKTQDNILSILWPVSAFALFLSSPWSYRMMLAPWQEVSWLLLYLLSVIFFLYNRLLFGIIALLMAGLFQWHWSFFLLMFYFSCLMLDFFGPHEISSKLLPPCMRSNQGAISIIAITAFSPFYSIIQALIAATSDFKIKHSGSNILFRIGIDNISNIHHGGLLGAIQFIGGNRFSLCLQSWPELSDVNSKIARFNCFTTITGMAVLSLLALAGYVWLCIREKEARWLSLPLLWVFFTFLLIFQQSFAAHLQGYSFIFCFIYAFGLLYLLRRSVSLLKMPSALVALCCTPIIIGVAINAIRVSYFTGING